MEGSHLHPDQCRRGLEVEHPRVVMSYGKRGGGGEVGKSV